MGIQGQRLKYFDRNAYTAVVLGFAALAFNVLSYLVFTDQHIPIGNFFLLCSAAALGPHYTLIAAAFGALLEVLFYTGDYVNGIRIVILCVATSYALQKHPRLPAYVVSAALWGLLFLPGLLYLSSRGSTFLPLSPADLVTAAFAETLLALVVGAVLLNHAAWNVVAHRPRHLTVQYLFLHIIPGVVLLTIFVALTAGQQQSGVLNLREYDGQLGLISGLMILGLCLSMVVAVWLARLLQRDSQQLLANNILRHQSGTSFSGLSSDYWRRQHSSVEIHYPRSANQPEHVTPHEGICALGRNGAIAFLNRRFRTIAELSDNDPLGKRLDDVTMNPVIRQQLLELLDRTFSKGPRTMELKLNQLPDKLRFIEVTSQFAANSQAASLADAAGDSVIMTLRDITDRRAVEHHLMKGQRQAALGNIVKGVAHAFNNSLATIVGHASTGQHTPDPAAVNEIFDNILESCRTAGSLVRGLLEYVEEQPVQVKKIDLAASLHKHVDLLQKLLGENIELKYECPQQPLGASCDPNLLLQAVSNLVINAKEAIGGKQGEIVMSLAIEQLDEEVSDLIPGGRPGSFCRLRISDNGEGMIPEVLARAFEPLFTTKSGSGNAGLGLSVVYGIIRSLDGFLTVESQPGKGTTVSLYLPMVELRAGEPVAESTEESKQNQLNLAGNQEKILVVEDDHNVREVVSSMLESLGYRVTSCSNGFDAIERCKENKFDLILADMIMPRMNGTELISKLRETHRDARTLIMTAYGVTEESLGGTTKILPKPFDMDTLAQVVKESLQPA